MQPLRRYKSFISDNERWAGFEFRPDDIVISTPPKAGTTWMQALCAMLIFDSVELPARLSTLSPWFDMNLHAPDDMRAALAAQQHRRFIKTHTPLDGLPYDERVTYVCVGRDPRDVGMSTVHHMRNTKVETVVATRAGAVGLDDLTELGAPPPPDIAADAAAYFRLWMEEEDSRYMMSTLAGVLHHLDTFWERRDAPNVALFHYSDLSADLPGQLRRLAAALDIDVDDDRVAAYAAAGSFGEMKARADVLVPNAEEAIWHSNDAFFRSGTAGGWREVLSPDDLARYEERVGALLSPPVARWAHGGGSL